ncbi:MAG: metallophosphoesterase [Bacillota bacterium]
MSLRAKLFTILLITAGFLLYNKNQITEFRINLVNIQSRKVEKDIRIAHISDLHSNERIDLESLKAAIIEFNPHMIALTGDLIDHKTDDLSTALLFVDALRETEVPMYFVEGNHEIANSLRGELLEELRGRDIVTLYNNSTRISINNKTINIYGVWFYVEESDYTELLRDINREQMNILLSHSPVKSARYVDGEVDLILSGHTHGGQVRLPIIGGLVSPGQGMFPEYDKGLMELPGGTILHIDSGIGNSVLPIRIMNPIQFSQITISSE